MYYKLLLRSGCIPRIVLPDSLQFADKDARSLSDFLGTKLSEKTVNCLLFQMLWTVFVLQYTWIGARLGDYLLSVPIYVYRTPRAMQLTVGESVSFRVDSMVVPVFYNMWYFITSNAEGSAIKQDTRSLDDVSDCTIILEEFASHPEPAFDIARKLLKYRSNAYALVTSDEFKFLRAPPHSSDTLLRL